MSAKPLVLVDGSSYLYRAFHALPELSTADGQPTGAVLGVLNMLYRLLDDYGPDHVAVVFDAPGKTFRDALYPEYKANRPPMPDELRAQLVPLLEAIDAMGLPLLRVPAVEADDVIGTLARQAADAGLDTGISTSDKDMAQLVDEHVLLVNTMDGTTLDVDGVKRKFGVAPAQIVDYLTLIGDTSDNVPGVPGVGPKTAAKWLAEHGDLDRLTAAADSIGGKAGERFRAALDQLPLYRQLVTIDRDVELPVTLDELKLREPDAGRLRTLYERLELGSLMKRRLGAATAPEGQGEADRPAATAVYDTVLSEAQLNEWLDRIATADLVALDTETTGLNYMEAELVGISLAVEPLHAAYIPLAHAYPGSPDQLDREYVLERMKAWLESDAPKLGHHLKFDTHIFANCGIELGGVAYDSMLESYVLNSTATRHDMDSVAAKYLGVETTKYEDVVGKGAKQIGFEQLDIETAARYAAEDADITLRLHQALWPQLEATPSLARLYRDIEQPLVRVLWKMEHTGVLVDAGMLRRQSQELAEAMARTEEAAYRAAGGPFNIGSPKQLQEVLYERLGLPVRGKTPKGQPSTAENVLQALADEYELPKLVLEHRALAKLKSTYTDRLPREVNPRTGRIHTSYHQAVAATGRLSSSEPNLQNIPIRTPEGRRIRQAFIAPEGCVLLAADYSQIELRIMAHLSADRRLLEAFAASEDIHRATAAEVFGVGLDQVSAGQRRSAKAINFGLIYGMSAFGLARQLGIERGEAQTYVDLYFERYPGVKRYMDDTRRLAHEQGYVETVFGRRLYLPEINARNAQRRQYAERSAINAPMQGTAADIIKRAMIRVDDWLAGSHHDAKLLMQVHDELVFEVRADQAEPLAAEVARIMEGAAELTVPLKVDLGTGANWDEAH
jgi:DNA polymerase I